MVAYDCGSDQVIRLLGSSVAKRSEARRKVTTYSLLYEEPFNDASGSLVEPSGIEPLTSCVQGRRSPS